VTCAAALPAFSVSLEAEKALHESNVRAAEQAFAANQEALRATKRKAAESSSSSSAAAADNNGGPSEEELARRKEFLLRQRELLLKKKKAERDGELEKFEADRAAIEAKAGGGASSAASAPKAAAASSAGPRALTEAEQLALRQEAMKSALVAHLKTVHEDVEAKRAGAKEEVQSKTLQQQLAEMEQLRQQKLAGLQQEALQRQQQEEERRRILQQMHDNMRKSAD
jgi:hypothetical protein